MNQKIINLYDAYTHGYMARREFLNKLALLAGGAGAASALLPLLENNYARAAIVPEDDTRLKMEEIEYPGATGKIKAYLARPRSEKKLPAVVVIHENRGLNPHIKDVTRRVGLAGFLALAPDALSPLGGTPEDADQAAAPYYGSQPAAEDVPRIKAALLLQYAGLDERINQGIGAYEEALKKAGVDYKVHIYEGANHAFNNDTNAARYDKEAAELAWRRTIEFLKDKLAD